MRISKSEVPAPIMRVEGPECMTFYAGQIEVLRLEESGAIYVQGRLATTDLEVVDALRAWLRSTGALR